MSAGASAMSCTPVCSSASARSPIGWPRSPPTATASARSALRRLSAELDEARARSGAVRRRDPPARADRPRPRRRPGRAGGAIAGSRRARGRRAAFPVHARGGGVLRLLGGPGQRRQVRAARPASTSPSRPTRRAARGARRRRRRAAARMPLAAPACADWPTASRRSAERCSVDSPPGAGTRLQAELPIARRPPVT